jgi:hypothetical protein
MVADEHRIRFIAPLSADVLEKVWKDAVSRHLPSCRRRCPGVGRDGVNVQLGGGRGEEGGIGKGHDEVDNLRGVGGEKTGVGVEGPEATVRGRREASVAHRREERGKAAGENTPAHRALPSQRSLPRRELMSRIAERPLIRFFRSAVPSACQDLIPLLLRHRVQVAEEDDERFRRVPHSIRLEHFILEQLENERGTLCASDDATVVPVGVENDKVGGVSGGPVLIVAEMNDGDHPSLTSVPSDRAGN